MAIIDDRPTSLELMEAALRRDDLQLHCFANAELGLEFILDRQPQVVLTDIVMPGLSGMELLERVVEFDPSIDVVLMTAFYSTESAVEVIRKGAADYLDKSITPPRLAYSSGALVCPASRPSRRPGTRKERCRKRRLLRYGRE